MGGVLGASFDFWRIVPGLPRTWGQLCGRKHKRAVMTGKIRAEGTIA